MLHFYHFVCGLRSDMPCLIKEYSLGRVTAASADALHTMCLLKTEMAIYCDAFIAFTCC